MLHDLIQRRPFGALLLALVLASPITAIAGFGHHRDRCPECGNAVCVPTLEVVKEKKHTWAVECKQICVPPIRWPWQSCCEPTKCGYVKNVKVLKKVEYECEKCGCQWEVKCVDCGPCQR